MAASLLRMRYRLAALLISALASFGCATGGRPYDLGQEAEAQQDFVAARRYYQEAVRDERDVHRREKAELRLANIQWRVFREMPAAREHLTHLTSNGTERSAAWSERVRLELQQRDFNSAREAARSAIATAKTKSDRLRGTVALAGVVADEAGLALADRHTWPANQEELRQTEADLQRIISENGPLLAPAHLLLVVGLFTDDGPGALSGWDAYYHVSQSNPPPQLIAAHRSDLQAVFSTWRGAASAPEDREKLVSALAGSRFYAEAAAVAMDPRARDWQIDIRPAVRDVIAYANSIRRVRELSDEYYRNMAAGHEDPDGYRTALQHEAATLWNALTFPEKKPPFDLSNFVGEISKRFGTVTNTGKTGNHYDLHMGHRVVDETFHVDQYGHRADVRFVALDSMVSNGYGSWTGDGRSADGGWADAGKIYQVRPEYGDGPTRDWIRVTDPDETAKDERELRKETARDAERARRYEVGPFPGMAQRLRRQYLSGLYRAFPMRDAFIARAEADRFQSSILLHEGRHAIDAGEKFNGSAADREYRAKLSEVALAAAPRDALGVIFSGAIGGKSPHGEANERLARGFMAWMEAHRAEIHGLTSNASLVPQIDLLTDDQLRAAIRSLDPFAQP